MEGTLCHINDPPPSPPCNDPSLTLPIHEYLHSQGLGCSVTGGYVYRGSAAEIQGHYVFGDWCSGRIWSRDPATGAVTERTAELPGAGGVPGQLVGFAEDGSGELHVVLAGGSLFRIDPAAASLTGQRLLVRDRDGDPGRRRVTVTSRDPAIVSPAPGSAGDPTLGGARLRVVNPTTLEEAVVDLPAVRWEASGTPPGSKGYRYRDRDLASGPCRSARVRGGARLRVSCRGAGIPFTLDEPAQGSLAATVELGTDVVACMLFGGAAVTRDTPAVGGATGVFRARNAPAPAGCAP
jgi:hypothetical protein